MNRAELRRQERAKGKTPTYNMSQGQVAAIAKQTIDTEIEQAKKEGIHYAVEVSAAIFMVTLNQLYGFSTGRLTKVLQKFNETFDCINAGTVDVEDFIKHCVEEFGIEIKIKPK